MGTILIVDDERDMVRMMSRILEERGHRVVCASSRESALELLHTDDIDLAIIDRDLPQLHGREVTSHIRAQPATEKLPIVTMTAVHVSLPDASAAVESGVDEFLFKPFMAETLINNVERLLG